MLAVTSIIGLTFSQFGHPLFPFAISFFIPLFAVTWIEIDRELSRWGYYVATWLRPRTVKLTGDPDVLAWETISARVGRTRSGWRRAFGAILFVLPGLAMATVPSVYLGLSNQHQEFWAAAWLLTAAGLTVNAIWVIWWLRLSDLYSEDLDVYAKPIDA